MSGMSGYPSGGSGGGAQSSVQAAGGAVVGVIFLLRIILICTSRTKTRKSYERTTPAGKKVPDFDLSKFESLTFREVKVMSTTERYIIFFRGIKKIFSQLFQFLDAIPFPAVGPIKIGIESAMSGLKYLGIIYKWCGRFFKPHHMSAVAFEMVGTAKDGTQTAYLIRDDRSLIQKLLFIQAGAFLSFYQISEDRKTTSGLVAHSVVHYYDSWSGVKKVNCLVWVARFFGLFVMGESFGVDSYQLRKADGTVLSSIKRRGFIQQWCSAPHWFGWFFKFYHPFRDTAGNAILTVTRPQGCCGYQCSGDKFSLHPGTHDKHLKMRKPGFCSVFDKSQFLPKELPFSLPLTLDVGISGSSTSAGSVAAKAKEIKEKKDEAKDLKDEAKKLINEAKKFKKMGFCEAWNKMWSIPELNFDPLPMPDYKALKQPKSAWNITFPDGIGTASKEASVLFVLKEYKYIYGGFAAGSDKGFRLTKDVAQISSGLKTVLEQTV